FLFAGLTFLLLNQFGVYFQKDSKPAVQETDIIKKQQPISINLVAIGDSLTQGVGDSSQRGGYVPLTAENLRQLGTIRSVQTSNFGKSGNTTIQITTRIEENEEIQHALKEASVIVVSAGGNDLIHSLRESGLQIDLPQAEKAR